MNKRTLTFTLCLLSICSAFSCYPDDYEDETSDMFNENDEESGYSDYVSTDGDSGSNDSDDGYDENDENDDASVPSIPTGVTADLNGTATYPYVSVKWEYVSGADSYNIYRSSSATGSYSRIGRSDALSFSDETVKKGKNYYKVTAVNSAGESAKSDYAFVEYDPNAAAPGAPQWGNCTVSGYKMTLRWSVETGSGYGAPDEIEIRAKNASGDTETVATISGTSTSYTFNVSDWLWYNDGNGCEMVYVGIVLTNSYGSESSTTKVYNFTEKKWVI